MKQTEEYLGRWCTAVLVLTARERLTYIPEKRLDIVDAQALSRCEGSSRQAVRGEETSNRTTPPREERGQTE